MKNRTRHLLGLLFIAAGLLGIGIDRASVGTAYSDPVAKIRAQDESVYANMALRLASTGDWLTPKVLGRYLLSKPPLLTWVSGLSLKFLGTSLVSLRLPALLAAVAATLIVFWLAWEAGSPLVAWCAALLLLSDAMWHAFARLCYTDMLLAGCLCGALAILYLDPMLARVRSLWGFAALSAAGVMVKNTAGLLPFAVLVLYALLAPKAKRPGVGRIGLALLITLLLVAPWHVYQVWAHPQWFWADYVQTQLLGFGFHPPAQTSSEGPLRFYARRLIAVDPLLMALLLAAVPFLVREVRRRTVATPALILAWLAVTTGALFVFQYRNLPYALYLIPAASLAAALYGPPFSARYAKAGFAVLLLAFGVKCYAGLTPHAFDRPWSIAFGAAERLPAVESLRSYYRMARPNELILVESDDDLYAEALPLPRIRYCFLDPDHVVTRYAPHYATLGITLTDDEFENLSHLAPAYRARLKQWGLDSPEPIGTAIVVTSRSTLPRLFQAYPHADFYVSGADWEILSRASPIDRTHRTVDAPNDRKFLLARAPEPGLIAQTQPLPPRW